MNAEDTAKEIKAKAIDLVVKFTVYEWDEVHGYMEDEKETRRYAIQCVDEIIETLNIPPYNGDPDYSPEFLGDALYWEEVKKEIKNYEI